MVVGLFESSLMSRVMVAEDAEQNPKRARKAMFGQERVKCK